MSSLVRRTRRRLDEGCSAPRAEDENAQHAESTCEKTLSSFSEEAPEHQLQLRVDIECLFDQEPLSDVQLVVVSGPERRRFRCHKVILASMSTYFHALFTGGMQESQQREIELHGVEPECFEQVLRLLYGKAVQITPNNLLTFMHLADFYGVPQLLERTEKLVEQLVTVRSRNCCAKLVEATELRCTQAQHHCLSVLRQDLAAAIKQEAFVQLEATVMGDVLAHDELLCPHEEVVLEGLMTWWRAQDEAMEGSRPQPLLDHLLPLVRWPLLSTETLSLVEQQYPELRANPRVSDLLLEGFRFNSADAQGKGELRKKNVRCNGRKGMLLLAPLLPDGPWEGPVPSPVAHSDAADGEGCQMLLSYVWNIPHFASLTCLSMYSPTFTVNGHKWKIYVYPKGNNNHHKQLSIYHDSGIVDTGQLQCTFKLAVINYNINSCKRGGSGAAGGADDAQKADQSTAADARRVSMERRVNTERRVNMDSSVVKESQHQFNRRAKDWGFREFMPLEKLEDPQAGFLNEDAITIGVYLDLSGG